MYLLFKWLLSSLNTYLCILMDVFNISYFFMKLYFKKYSKINNNNKKINMFLIFLFFSYNWDKGGDFLIIISLLLNFTLKKYKNIILFKFYRSSHLRPAMSEEKNLDAIGGHILEMRPYTGFKKKTLILAIKKLFI